MHCPTLKELPPPPPGKTGWPWTEESPQLPFTMRDGSSWPRVSIVTPSLNQEHYIEETIRSALLQGYPDLEYILIDGGSTDSTVNIIQKYFKWLSYWASEPDGGQSDAINKGIRRCSGELVNWLNADDLLLKGSVGELASAWHLNPGHMMVGSGIDFDEARGSATRLSPKHINVSDIVRFWEGWFGWLQPSVFFPREAFLEAGGVDETLCYSMDIDLYCRIMQHTPVVYLSSDIAMFRRHESAKTRSHYHEMILEHIRVCRRYQYMLGASGIQEWEKQAVLFVLRRTKRLFLDLEYKQSVKYFSCALRLTSLRAVLSVLVQLLGIIHHKIVTPRVHQTDNTAESESPLKPPRRTTTRDGISHDYERIWTQTLTESELRRMIAERRMNRRAFHHMIHRYIRRNRSPSVLEIGCGTAIDLNVIAQTNQDALFFGTDFVDKSIVLSRRVSALFQNRVNFVISDTRNLPFSMGTFDLVFSQGLLEHFGGPMAIILEQLRLLKDGGILIINVPQRFTGYTIEKKLQMRRGEWRLGWEREFSYGDLRRMGKALDLIEKEVLGYQYWRSRSEPAFVLRDLYGKIDRRNPWRRLYPFTLLGRMYDRLWEHLEKRWGHYFLQNIVIVFQKNPA